MVTYICLFFYRKYRQICQSHGSYGILWDSWRVCKVIAEKTSFPFHGDIFLEAMAQALAHRHGYVIPREDWRVKGGERKGSRRSRQGLFHKCRYLIQFSVVIDNPPQHQTKNHLMKKQNKRVKTIRGYNQKWLRGSPMLKKPNFLLMYSKRALVWKHSSFLKVTLSQILACLKNSMQASDGINLSRMDEQTYDAPLIKKNICLKQLVQEMLFFWLSCQVLEVLIPIHQPVLKMLGSEVFRASAIAICFNTGGFQVEYWRLSSWKLSTAEIKKRLTSRHKSVHPPVLEALPPKWCFASPYGMPEFRWCLTKSSHCHIHIAVTSEPHTACHRAQQAPESSATSGSSTAG